MIGKKIGNALYIHKHYIDVLEEKHKQQLESIEYEDTDLYNKLMDKCEILKFEPNAITFIDCNNFNEDLNPVIKTWYKFTCDENEKWCYLGKKLNSEVNPLILHKKELMVGEDYDGFSVELAKEWDQILEDSGIPDFSEKKKIGRLKYWDACVSKFENQNKELYNNFIEKWEDQF